SCASRAPRTILPNALYDLLVLCAARNDDLTVLFECANHVDDRLLRLADFAHARRSEQLDLFAERFARALRHVLEDAREQIFVGNLERERQVFAVDFLEDALDRAVVEIDD